MNLKKALGYYFFASNRRKLLDQLLFANQHLYHGVVLDIGGRDRGRFRSPKKQVEKWIIADIEADRQPDIVLDVSAMSDVETESVDVINALELFEHVEEPEKGLGECARVLKRNGVLILSMPFLFPIHGDPNDFQRWTPHKIMKELSACRLSVEEMRPMGYFFTVLTDNVKTGLQSIPVIRYLGYILYPLLDLIAQLDRLDAVRQHSHLSRYTTGYFVVAKK